MVTRARLVQVTHVAHPRLKVRSVALARTRVIAHRHISSNERRWAVVTTQARKANHMSRRSRRLSTRSELRAYQARRVLCVIDSRIRFSATTCAHAIKERANGALTRRRIVRALRMRAMPDMPAHAARSTAHAVSTATMREYESHLSWVSCVCALACVSAAYIQVVHNTAPSVPHSNELRVQLSAREQEQVLPPPRGLPRPQAPPAHI